MARLRQNIITPQDAAEELFQRVLLSTYSTDALLYLRECNTKSHYHSAEALQELWDAKSHYDKKMLRTQADGHQQPPQRRSIEGWGWSKDTPTPGREGEPPKSRGGVGPSGHSWGDGQRESGMVPRVLSLAMGRLTKGLVCYGCQKPGHIRRECPEAEAKLGRIRSPGPEPSAGRREGKVNGMSFPVTLDTGANMTAFPGRFIAPVQFTRKNIRVVLANMDTTSMREAVLSIEVDGKAQSLTVIALKDEAPEGLLGTDHEVTRELLNPKPIGPKSEVISQFEVCAITRAKSQAQKKEWAKDMAADTRDGAEPKESFTNLVDPIPDKLAKSSPIPYQFDGNGYREVKKVVVGPNTSPWGEERAWVEVEERFEDEENLRMRKRNLRMRKRNLRMRKRNLRMRKRNLRMRKRNLRMRKRNLRMRKRNLRMRKRMRWQKTLRLK